MSKNKISNILFGLSLFIVAASLFNTQQLSNVETRIEEAESAVNGIEDRAVSIQEARRRLLKIKEELKDLDPETDHATATAIYGRIRQELRAARQALGQPDDGGVPHHDAPRE